MVIGSLEVCKQINPMETGPWKNASTRQLSSWKHTTNKQPLYLDWPLDVCKHTAPISRLALGSVQTNKQPLYLDWPLEVCKQIYSPNLDCANKQTAPISRLALGSMQTNKQPLYLDWPWKYANRQTALISGLALGSVQTNN